MGSCSILDSCQTASVIVKRIALGIAGMGCEDSLMHLMNLVWPNCFEMSPHVIRVGAAINAMCILCLGPGILVLQGLFHGAQSPPGVSFQLLILHH
jgi:splicing factor 3B subunit 1